MSGLKPFFQVSNITQLTLLTLTMLAGCALFSGKAQAVVITPYFEAVLVPSVSTAWTTVPLDNTYQNAIPVCTYVLGTFAGNNPNFTNPPAVTRIRNVGASSFQLRIQGWLDSAASTSAVHCMVMDEGAHTLPDGRRVEAHSVLSDQSSGRGSTDGGFNQATLEDVSADIVHSYTEPVVVGQVMSHNDSRASVIFMTDCDRRQNHPFMDGMSDGICIGKHLGVTSGSRNPETVGYIIGETGSGTVNNVFYELALGPDIVRGNNNGNNGTSYPLSAHHAIAVLSQGAEDGGDGSWAVLYGSSPLSANAMELAVDEDIFAGDVKRNHTTEPVYYWAFSAAEITLIKNVINDDGGTATLNDFVLSAAGPVTITGSSGTPTVTKAAVEPGTYLISEITIPGYTAGEWVCTGANRGTSSKIELVPGDHATCTIVNDDDRSNTPVQNIDVAIRKSVNDLTPNVGDTVTYALSIENIGPDTAINLHVLDQVLAGFSYVSASMTGGDVRDELSPTATGLDWTINTLPAGTSVLLTFQAIVLAP